MIISASRRTDIPAFYSEWFMNRLRQGFCYVRNPYYPQQVSKIILDPKTIDGIVFWTKDPTSLMPYLNEIWNAGYKFYFQFTITPYGNKDIEPNLPDKQKLMNALKQLTYKLNSYKVIWRYDPIFYSDKIDHEYHAKQFARMAGELSAHTKRCVISFLDAYDSIKPQMEKLKIRTLTDNEMVKLGKDLLVIARDNNIEIESCAEPVISSSVGIRKGQCIDNDLLEGLHRRQRSIKYKKDKSQRAECGCSASIDIGVYGTCKHYCAYCYANRGVVMEPHDVNSPFMFGGSKDDDIIRERKK